MNDSESAKRERFIREGAGVIGDVGGATVGAAVGTVVAGPIGTVVGAGAGAAFSLATRRVVDEFIGRKLSDRERARVAGGMYFASRRINARLEAGEVPRNDGFFDEGQSGRSQAEELFEGALLKCKNEHEEKKTPYLANIFANSSFQESIDPNTANFALQKGQELTYQQICLLALIHRQDEIGADMTEYWRGGWERADSANYQTLRLQLYGLGSEGHHFVSYAQGTTSMTKPYLTPVGCQLYDLMGLDEMPREEIQRVWNSLQEFDPTGFE